MRKKNKKEKEVTRLYNEVVKVSMTDFTISRKENIVNDRKVSLCAINGERYIPLCTTTDISYFFRRRVKVKSGAHTGFCPFVRNTDPGTGSIILQILYLIFGSAEG